MKKIVNTAIASSILASALIVTPTVSHAAGKERCADIVKAGKNKCAVKAAGLSCEGSASVDNLKGAWIKVPAGTCTNIVNVCTGAAEAPEGVKAAKLEKVCKKVADQTDKAVVGGRLVDKNGESI